ncbi:MAG: hypothetical protein AAGE52_12005 [Myxococcota bacterium]
MNLRWPARTDLYRALVVASSIAAAFVLGRASVFTAKESPKAPYVGTLHEMDEWPRAIVLAAHEGLRENDVVLVRAIGTGYLPCPGARERGRQILVDHNGHHRWVPGCALAVESDPDSRLFPNWSWRIRLPDGTQLWRGTQSVREDDGDYRTGYLVRDYEGRSEPVLVASSMAAGTARRLVHHELRDVVGDGDDELVLYFEETLAEVGSEGHFVQIYRLDPESLTLVFAHHVRDPTNTGHSQRETGWFRVGRDALTASTLVLASDEAPIHQRNERWTRNDHGEFDHQVNRVPLRLADGRRVVGFEGPAPGQQRDRPVRFHVEDAGRVITTAAPLADARLQQAFTFREEGVAMSDWIDGIE